MDNKEWNLELQKYIKEGEPNKIVKTELWKTAIGLQEVDGLKPSEYLVDIAKEHIEGKINISDVETKINDYYKINDNRNKDDNTEEADKVAVKITEILSDKSFNFNPTELITIHRKLFTGIFKHAGTIRDYNFTKNEWILNGDTVIYASYDSIMDSLKYDFELEKNFSYKDLSLDESIKHLSRFISNIWQIHPFCEGNTRTTAVFVIKYLRTFGFDINNDVFAENSWYFRNSLVRANYKNFDKNIFEDISFLEKFLYNLLSKSNYDLKNRYMHIDYLKNQTEDELQINNYSLEEQAIINIIKINPLVTQQEISNHINKSLRTVKTIMIKMQEKGLIERKNGKKDAEWIIIG